MRDAPTWWDWPFVMGDHVLERMPERGFNEVDLREMIEEASGGFPTISPADSCFRAICAAGDGRWWSNHRSPSSVCSL